MRPHGFVASLFSPSKLAYLTRVAALRSIWKRQPMRNPRWISSSPKVSPPAIAVGQLMKDLKDATAQAAANN